ncbi:MAG TPA: BLUF domain-containing protein [Caulobacteraceae bacterium]|nr:BLUF domain-containing protein [Caulobacteraceae bacterium]
MSLVPLLPEAGLVRVIYASRWGARAREDLPHVVRAVVAQSAPVNAGRDVTSLLLVHGGWFVQALEGPVAAVRDIFAKIASDPRHFDVSVLASGSAEQRLFGAFAMAERRLSPNDDRLLEQLGLDEAFRPDQLGADAALLLMTSISQIAQAA